MEAPERYRVALLDWLACAVGGSGQPAARAARAVGDGLLERVTWAGCAGHVLDYDDTYSPGLVHCTAPVAPVALLLGAELGRDIDAVLDAHAAGFEMTAAVARAGHPALYERGWHPTAVCGTAGAAVAAARLLGLTADRTDDAVALALLRAGGLRAAFGSDGKALQVGMAAAAGLHAARLAQGGARVPLDAVSAGPAGYTDVFGAAWPPEGAAAGRAPELDQGLPVLSRDPQRDRGRAPAARQRTGAVTRCESSCTPSRDPRRRSTTCPTACRPSSRSRTWPPSRCCAEPRGCLTSTASTTRRARWRGGYPCAPTPRSPRWRRMWRSPGCRRPGSSRRSALPAGRWTRSDCARSCTSCAGDRLDGALDDPSAPATALVAAAGLA